MTFADRPDAAHRAVEASNPPLSETPRSFLRGFAAVTVVAVPRARRLAVAPRLLARARHRRLASPARRPATGADPLGARAGRAGHDHAARARGEPERRRRSLPVGRRPPRPHRLPARWTSRCSSTGRSPRSSRRAPHAGVRPTGSCSTASGPPRCPRSSATAFRRAAIDDADPRGRSPSPPPPRAAARAQRAAVLRPRRPHDRPARRPAAALRHPRRRRRQVGRRRARAGRAQRRRRHLSRPPRARPRRRRRPRAGPQEERPETLNHRVRITILSTTT